MRWQRRTSKVEVTCFAQPHQVLFFLGSQDIPSIDTVSIAFRLHFCIYIPFPADISLISRIALVLHSIFQHSFNLDYPYFIYIHAWPVPFVSVVIHYTIFLAF